MAGLVKGDVVVVPFPLAEDDFTEGTLRRASNVRPNRLFTADRGIVLYRVGRINTVRTQEVVDRIVEILTTP